jgi:surface-anchored protein
MRKMCKCVAVVCSAFLASSAAPVMALTDLTEGEIDVGVNYEDGAWDLHIHDETNEMEFAPDEARYVGTFPAGGPYVFPAVEDPMLPFVGIGAEELVAGTFVGDTVALKLVGLNGPGTFKLTRPGVFGLTTIYDTTDGLSVADVYAVAAGGHEHLNWEFSAVGVYTLTVEATATLPGGVLTSSGPVDYTFVVAVPEPTALAALTALAGVGLRRRRA